MGEPAHRTRQFLRIEGVNFKAFLDDTLDLSVIRGGGLLLLNATEVAREVIEAHSVAVAEVNSGASVGIFSFLATADEAVSIRDKIAGTLANHAQLRHATFVIDTEPAANGFAATRAALMAKNRWRQMQTLSLVYPALRPGPREGQWVCEADHVRPAAQSYRHWDIEKREARIEALSESAYSRHEYGAKERVEFYKREAAIDEPFFADDLNQIAGGAKTLYGSLDRKVAVIHLDGNGFGRLFAAHCDTPEKQGAASAKLRASQRQFLQTLFAAIRQNPQGWYFERLNEDGVVERALRLETLLWGGDELRFVVPAWKGFYFLDLFFRQSQTWRLFDTQSAVSHSAGIVFCNCKCNIHAAAHLAKDLCETAKEVHAVPGDFVVYQILESFDHIGRDVEASYFKQRYPFLAEDISSISLAAGKLQDLWHAAHTLRDKVPRRRLHEVVRLLMANKTKDATDRIKDTAKELDADTTTALRSFAGSLAAKSELSPAAWFHLNELWDYMGFESWQGALREASAK